MVVGGIRLRRLIDHVAVRGWKRAPIHARVRQQALVQDVHRLDAAVRAQLQDLALEDLHLHPEDDKAVRYGIAEATHPTSDTEVVPERVFAYSITCLLEKACVVGHWRWRGNRHNGGLLSGSRGRLRLCGRGRRTGRGPDEADRVSHDHAVGFVGDRDPLAFAGLEIERAERLPVGAIGLLVDGHTPAFEFTW